MSRNVRFPYTILIWIPNPSTAPLWMESAPNADAVGYETRPSEGIPRDIILVG